MITQQEQLLNTLEKLGIKVCVRESGSILAHLQVQLTLLKGIAVAYVEDPQLQKIVKDVQ